MPNAVLLKDAPQFGREKGQTISYGAQELDYLVKRGLIASPAQDAQPKSADAPQR